MRSAGAEEELAADTAGPTAVCVEEELAADTAGILALAGLFYADPSWADTAAGLFRMRAAGGSYEDALAGLF